MQDGRQQNRGQQNRRNERDDSFIYAIDKFLDDDGLIIKTLISDSGKNNVKDLSDYLARDVEESKKISINQVRKFYDNFLKIYHNKSSAKEKKIQLIMLKAQVQYAVKRLKIINFGKFFDNRINILTPIENEDTFNRNLDAFKLHFEAMIGYFPK